MHFSTVILYVGQYVEGSLTIIIIIIIVIIIIIIIVVVVVTREREEKEEISTVSTGCQNGD